jgi:hypothetical protein
MPACRRETRATEAAAACVPPPRSSPFRGRPVWMASYCTVPQAGPVPRAVPGSKHGTGHQGAVRARGARGRSYGLTENSDTKCLAEQSLQSLVVVRGGRGIVDSFCVIHGVAVLRIVLLDLIAHVGGIKCRA